MYAYNDPHRIPYGSDNSAKMYASLGNVMRANPEGLQGSTEELAGNGMASNDDSVFNNF